MNLLFGVHNHQPVGNFEHVFQKANQDCYRPFIDTLYRYPEVKSTLHFSGSLIDWLLKNDRGLLERLKEMIQRAQVEILTGGYYEPILPIIPERDQIGQIRMLSDFIKDYFDYEPKGCWIGERVWEPHLAGPLAAAGVKYILLDDFHFRYAGIKEDLLGYYVTEEKKGLSLAVFPINKRLRYSVPFSQPAQPINYLKGLAAKEENQAAIIIDDGEKFGLWPGTHKWVYGERWLEKFFELLLKNQDWLKVRTVSEYMSRHKPKGSCVLAGASYEEMMDWSGGNFSNFFSKYPEANNLHKRMLYVSDKVNKAGDNKQAKRYLYMSQSNCPFWHGVFGGLYLTHLRRKAYKHLIRAESFIDEKNSSARLNSQVFDFDKDGADEIIIKNPFLRLFISPKNGAGIFELDYIPEGINLLDTMARREEPYHAKIKAKRGWSFKPRKISSIHDLLTSKEKGLENCLVYDSYRRLSLLDHFLPRKLTLKDFKGARYKELGDFINAPYSARQKKDKHGINVILQRQGRIDYDNEQIPLVVTKQIFLNDKDTQLFIEYKLENPIGRPLDIVFGIEFNISPQSQQAPNNLRCSGQGGEQRFSLTEDIEASDINQLRFQDRVGGIECVFYFDQEAGLWSHPLETVSASEQGFERNYQQTVLLPHWRIRLDKSWQAKIVCNLHGI